MIDQRTGRFALTINLVPEDIPLCQLLRDLADRMVCVIEQATDDGRDYDFQIRVTADITVDASQAKVGEYVTEPPFQVPKEIETLETDGVLFKRTAVGWQRIG
jgi:hypothetical protein